MCCSCITRREFIELTGGMAAALGLASVSAGAAESQLWDRDAWNPGRPFLAIGTKIRVLPILQYATPEPREKTSWKSWGGVQTDQAALEELQRIDQELAGIQKLARFPIEILPAAKVRTLEDLPGALSQDHDVRILYPATGSGNLLRSLVAPEKQTLIFIRHRSGPVYYWYESLSTRYVSTEELPPRAADSSTLPGVSVDDVVVDEPEELLWRLEALFAAKNLQGSRVVALGGPWGKYSPDAPALAKSRFALEIIDVPYTDFEPRVRSALADRSVMGTAQAWTDRFLSDPGVMLETDPKFVVHAFVLYGLFKQLLEENNAQVFTIQSCMGTIMPMSDTTACLTLGLLNDEGLIAFCESDFVVIPAGILLRYLTHQPVFLHNSTFPHKGIVTCAHCAAPRRMDASRYEPTRILTHYESEFGAAPKVEIPIGQEVTFINPEYSTERWMGFRGTVEGNPFLEICRSQQDVRIHGEWTKLLREVRDSHWLMVYGNHLRSAAYASRKVGIHFETIEQVV